MTEQHFDIVIIGAGPGGYSTALRAAQLGKTVALVERDDTLGGTCLNRGCIPSKALLTAAHSVENVRRAERMGVNVALQSIDFGRLRDFRMSTVETMTKGLAGLLSHRGVTVFRGKAQLKNGHEVHIAPALGETQVLRSIKAGVGEPAGPELTISGGDIVLATGSRPLPLPDDPFSGALIDSTQALELDTFPSSAVIIGAGAVALEFASLWNASGCKVTLHPDAFHNDANSNATAPAPIITALGWERVQFQSLRRINQRSGKRIVRQRQRARTGRENNIAA